MDNTYLNEIKNRRSIYNLGKNISIPADEIVDQIKEAIRQSPSAMNSQSVRAIILLEEAHIKFWDTTLDILHKVANDEQSFSKTETKVNSAFKSGIGTILFFTDNKVIKDLQDKFSLYKDKFSMYGEHAMGIANVNVWSTLASINIGASLQHYSPLIDDYVKNEFNIPADWELKAQMPFGSIENPADEKTYMDDQSRFRVIK